MQKTGYYCQKLKKNNSLTKLKKIKLTFPNAQKLAEAAANFIANESNEIITKKDYFTIALSGGKTPELLYHILAQSPYKESIQWKKIIVCFGDERFVPASSEESNYKMASLALLQKVSLPKKNILKVKTARTNPAASAVAYEKEIRKYVSVKKPFDLILLGIGEDGHTASLFPGSKLLTEKKKWIKEIFVPEKKMHRISFTLPCINNAKNVMFLVSGKNKRSVIKKIFAEKRSKLPAAMVKPSGKLIWLMDTAAAGR
jgi:6-phosphogluconolactonase